MLHTYLMALVYANFPTKQFPFHNKMYGAYQHPVCDVYTFTTPFKKLYGASRQVCRLNAV
jgi:hypothetical protein